MSNATSVHKIYRTVVDDVISNVKEAFLDEGIDEQVLTELKQLWESKLHATKALETPQEIEGTVYTNPGIALLQQQHVTHQRMMAAGAQVQQAIPVPIQLSHTEMTAGGAAATMALQNTLFQHQLTALNANSITLHPAGNGHFYMPSTITLSQPGTIVQANAQSANQTLQQTVQGMIQLDGAADTSSSEEDDFDNDDNEEESDEEQKEEEDQGAEEEPLNSDDDVSDDDPAEIFDTENVIVCQYDKINRNKNKWKFHLKDGIMNLRGRDYVFQRATGDAEW